MKKNKYFDHLYEVDFSMTYLFWEIYGGDEFYPLRENATLRDYKTHFSKLIKTLEKAFIDTVLNTDNSHLFEINNLVIEQLEKIENSKKIDDLSNSLLIFYPRFCFLIIGKRINNTSQKTKDNRSTWEINQHRQILYLQNSDQQKNLILDLIKQNKIPEFKSYKEFDERFKSERNNDENFLDWFKRKYSQIYFRIFDPIK